MQEMLRETIAIIVPIYNAEKYLNVCIESILAQKYTDIEILLVDDGSKDASFKICKDYEKKDSRVKALHQENGGVLSAKYLGLINTSAEYVMFVDADDWIMPEMCERLYFFMKEYKTEMVASGIIRAFPNGKNKYDYNALPKGVYKGDDYKKYIIPHMLCNGFFFQCGVDPSMAIKLFKRELILPLIQKAAPHKFYYGEDTAIVFPYMLQISSIYIADECFYYHRQYDNHASFYIGDPTYKDKLNELYVYLKNIFTGHEQSRILIKQLDYFIAYSMYLKYSYDVHKIVDGFQELTEREYVVPFNSIPKGKKIMLYGAGNVGKVFYAQLVQAKYCSEIVWVDKQYAYWQEEGLPVCNPDMETEVDCYLIAIANRRVAEEIRELIMQHGIAEEKIVWEDPLLRMW